MQHPQSFHINAVTDATFLSFSEFSDRKLISTITAANCAPPEIFYVNTAQHVFMGELALHSKLEDVKENFFVKTNLIINSLNIVAKQPSILKKNKDNIESHLEFVTQLTQPILPNFGGFFCLCTIGPPKRLSFLFLFPF